MALEVQGPPPVLHRDSSKGTKAGTLAVVVTLGTGQARAETTAPNVRGRTEDFSVRGVVRMTTGHHHEGQWIEEVMAET